MIEIRTITRNGEIWRKILNSVAHKYDCGVHFTFREGRLGFEGDRDCAMEIAKEAIGLIDTDGPSAAQYFSPVHFSASS